MISYIALCKYLSVMQCVYRVVHKYCYLYCCRRRFRRGRYRRSLADAGGRHGRQAVRLRHLRPPLQLAAQSAAPRTHAHGRTSVRVRVRPSVPLHGQPGRASAHSHGRAAVPVLGLRAPLQVAPKPLETPAAPAPGRRASGVARSRKTRRRRAAAVPVLGVRQDVQQEQVPSAP